jgi:hypothetical protein
MRRLGPRSRGRAAVRVQDADDPLLLGVHPARAVKDDERLNRVPEFVVRDSMAELCERLRTGGFVLLIGESTAGKSRLAYESMRASLPRHVLHRPAPGAPLDDLVAAVSSGRHVIWFDEFDLYLGANGLSVDELNRLLVRRRGRHVVVLATMRIREYDRYSARNREASDAATWRAGRAVLLLAENPIEIPRAWSKQELRRAQTSTVDPRVAKAVQKANRYGVAEVLAAGPELVADWRRAMQMRTHPRGAALVAAAVDCRRMGLHRPVPTALLDRLHHGYLPDDVTPLETMDAAVAWATTVVFGSSSLLLTTPDGGHLAFDYLIDQPFLPAVPDASWTTLLSEVTPAEAYDVGWAAIELQRSDHGLTAFARARHHHIPNAEYSYVVALGNAGSVTQAAGELRQIAQERATRLGPEHPDTLQARHDRARYLGESGQTHAAVRELREIIAVRTRLLGPDAEATLTAREFLGRFIGDGGNYAAAVAMLSALATQEERLWGPDHLQPMVTRTHAARYLARLGQPAVAAAELRQLTTRIEEQFGPDSPFCLSARYEHARATGEAGAPTQAVRLLEDLLLDQHRVLGSRHVRLLGTSHQIARFTGESGDVASATETLRRLVADFIHRLGAQHHRTLEVRLDLVRFICLDGSADALAQGPMLAADCVTALGPDHPLSKKAALLTKS